MKRFLLLFLLAVPAVFLVGCSSVPTEKSTSVSSKAYRSSSTSSSDTGTAIAELAQHYIGTPYLYGGNSPSQGFDCSGLVLYTHKQVGVWVPRTSSAQYQASRTVSMSELRPGDLLFYNINGKPSHVAIYIGQRQFIHAPSSGKTVRVGSMDNPYFKPRLVKAGRLY